MTVELARTLLLTSSWDVRKLTQSSSGGGGGGGGGGGIFCTHILAFT